ncbi:MAG TPA: 2-oxoglutarate dehydrogenase E1 component [Kofleriaceae bacterium]|nr:2-oxoglutarate dehydrogenase E1 component [Kofleriaceae bacterium]
MPILDALLQQPDLADDLYRRHAADPSSVPAELAELFAELGAGRAAPRFLTEDGALPDGVARAAIATGIQIYDLVHTYRQFGHMAADIDPLGTSPRSHPSLELAQFELTEADLDEVVSCVGFHGAERATVRDTLAILQETYCGPVGVEYMAVTDKAQRDWLQSRMEPLRNRPHLSAERKRELLRELIAADTFEEQLQRMYPGAKRFSLEGGTTLITVLGTLVGEAPDAGVAQLVIGMAHRGRLNVLAHVLGKPLAYILAEFEGRPLPAEAQGYGDVKYHMGYSYDRIAPDGRTVHLSLAFNPSHLEVVGPVVEGVVRAKQDQMGDVDRSRVVPVLLHGDAAFAAQGVVAETLLIGGLAGYSTGGTIHVIVNNQVGFTTSPHESRSTRYASDLAQSVRAPVFHVNADHPEAVSLVAQLALAYRQTFHVDVVIDLVCFRRHGHNELDDASFTQPVMARLIDGHPAVSRIYADKLVRAGTVAQAEVDGMVDQVKAALVAARETGRAMSTLVTERLGGAWKGLKPAGADWSADTAVPRERLESIARALTRAPDGFHWHPRLQRMMQQRARAVLEDGAVDWGGGEALALGSLLLDGRPVRLSGQDSGRGTFGHRHAIYSDLDTGARWVPLDHIAADQARFEVLNSPLSEEAVLAFEYGYSSADPWRLVVWEAQFGDFINGAQIVVDQLLASAEFKWGRMAGLVLLLPHGYEGQGPEHSSARLERFLELCAEDNMQVVNLSTPAQLFHCLRQQMARDFRKPLVVMSPKSLLRHPLAVSPVADLVTGRFQRVIDDAEAARERGEARRVLLSSGRIYYRLLEERQRRGLRAAEAPLVRLEQLYPFPRAELSEILSSFPALEQLVWVQEEPRNMGAWRNLLHRFEASLPAGVAIDYVGRHSRAVPATGSFEVHQEEEAAILEAALAPARRGAKRGRAASPEARPAAAGPRP